MLKKIVAHDDRTCLLDDLMEMSLSVFSLTEKLIRAGSGEMV